MSSSRVLKKGGGSDADGSLSHLLQELKSLHTKMDGMKVSLDTKMDGMKNSFEKQLNAKVDNLRESLEKLVNENRDCLKAELAQRTKEIQENLDMEIGHMVARLEQVEAKTNRAGSKEIARYDPDVSIIICGLRYEEGEDVMELVKELLTEVLQWDSPRSIVAAERLRERGGRPGVIKVEFGFVQDKLDVLRKKQGLKSNGKFQGVYIRSAKTHTERLIELNFKTLLEEIPSGRNFYVVGNGRVRRHSTPGVAHSRD